MSVWIVSEIHEIGSAYLTSRNSATKKFITAEFNSEKLQLGAPASAHYFLTAALGEMRQLSSWGWGWEGRGGFSAEGLCPLTRRLLTAEPRQHSWLLFLCGVQL